MEIIKVNYNNVAVKKPQAVAPFFFCYRKYGQEDNEKMIFIIVQDGLEAEPFFTDFYFEVYIDDLLVTYLTKNSEHKIVITNEELFSKTTINVRISGYYTDGRNKKYFQQVIRQVKTIPYCSENVFCSEDIKANDFIEGYIVNKSFYLTKINDRVYTDEVTKQQGVIYYDHNTESLYNWFSSSNKFIKL